MAEVDFYRNKNGLLDVGLESIRDPNYDTSKGLQPQMAYDRNGNLVQVGSYPNRFSLFDSGPGRLIAGAAGDLERGIKYGQEGIKTGFEKAANFVGGNLATGVSNIFTDDYGNTIPGINTPKEIQKIRDSVDAKFDTPKISEFGQQESLVGRASNWAKDTFDYLSGGNVTDVLKSIASDTPDIVPGITAESITDRFNKDVDNGAISNSSQSDVTDIIKKTSEVTKSTGEISTISEQVSSILNDTTPDKQGEVKKVDKLTGAINGFMDKLDTPGFQTALAMHMEAKNGGDVTSVLFEGMKVQKKSKKDLLNAHITNLAIKKGELGLIESSVNIMAKLNKANKIDSASKEEVAFAAGLVGPSSKFDLKKGDIPIAAGVLADSIKRFEAAGYDKATAAEYALKELQAGGKLKEDANGFFSNLFSFLPGEQSAGEFDLSGGLIPPKSNVSTNLPNSKADMLKQLMAANTNISEAEILQYINTTYPSLQ